MGSGGSRCRRPLGLVQTRTPGASCATVHALDDFTLDVEEGETLSLVGESGCGKSTTGFCILNLHRPTAGTVRYKGQNIPPGTVGSGLGDDSGALIIPLR